MFQATICQILTYLMTFEPQVIDPSFIKYLRVESIMIQTKHSKFIDFHLFNPKDANLNSFGNFILLTSFDSTNWSFA